MYRKGPSLKTIEWNTYQRRVCFEYQEVYRVCVYYRATLSIIFVRRVLGQEEIMSNKT